MTAALTFLKAYWLYAVLVMCAAWLAFSFRDAIATRDALTVQVAAEAKRANDNAATIAALNKAVTEMHETAAAQAAVRRDLNSLRSELLRSINEASPEADGPLAPVLAATLDQLRDTEAGHPIGSGSQNRP